VDLYRLPSGSDHEVFLVPSGPDAIGEPRLAASLFPDETPARELASVLVANVGRRGVFDLDLDETPLRGRTAGGPWEPICALAPDARLPEDLAVRFRALGGGVSKVRLDPGHFRRILVALPRARRLADLSDVELGEVSLVRDRLELERLRRFRIDPAGTTSGR
jgi:hypothetical protein